MGEPVWQLMAVLVNAWIASDAIKRRSYFWLVLSSFLGLYWVLKLALT
jgi:hypothetical protein